MFYLEMFEYLTSNILNYVITDDNIDYMQRFPQEFYYSADLPNSFSQNFELNEEVEPCLPDFTILEYTGIPYTYLQVLSELPMCEKEEKGGNDDNRCVEWLIDTASYFDNDFLCRCLRNKKPGRGKFFLRFKKSDCIWYGRKFKYKFPFVSVLWYPSLTRRGL